MLICSNRFKIGIGLLLTVAAVLRPAPAHADAVTPSQIQDAITKAKAYLYSREKDGNWEAVPTAKSTDDFPNNPSGMQFGGMTALATFALLSCGDTPTNNDKLKAAVEWLEKVDMHGIYAMGIRAQIWNLLPEDETIKKLRRKDKERLLAAIHTKGEAASFYSYGEGTAMVYGQSAAQQYDHSVSQFGVLGLWSLVQCGEEVDTHYWRDFDKAWRAHQQKDGGWGYRAELFPDGKGQEGQGGELLSMTAAGVATLFITQDYANLSSKCEGNIKDPNIDSGMAWIGKHLKDIDAKEWAQAWHYYTLFGICRIGLASGYKYIGDTNWFQWGAEMLLKDQDGSGGWGGGRTMSFGKGTDPVDPSIYESSFALLFLSRGRAPILFNKLQYELAHAGSKKGTEGSWNQRPRDIANLTRFIGKEREIIMNWQIVNLQQPVEDLLDAPMLYMAGNQSLKFSPEDAAKLKDYVNRGGIIVGHSDCTSANFNESFKKLGEQLFPGEKFRDMPADHPIARLESFNAKGWNPKPRVEILDNGIRVRLLLLANGDPAKDWQTQSFPNIKKYPFGQLMMNIYLYSVDTQPLRAKGDTYLINRDTTDATATAKIARIQYTGNWDPEPGGWPRAADIVHNKDHLDLTIVPIELGKGLLTNEYKLADLTGTAAVGLTDAQWQELKKYVDGGGTLLIDAAGGKAAFVTSVQEQLLKAFAGSDKLAVLPIDSPVYAGGDPIKEVSYRRFAKTTLGNLHTPQLRGLTVGNRIGVFLSNEDLAVGLVGQSVDGVMGYDPDSAVHLVRNVLLYAIKPPG